MKEEEPREFSNGVVVSLTSAVTYPDYTVRKMTVTNVSMLYYQFQQVPLKQHTLYVLSYMSFVREKFALCYH